MRVCQGGGRATGTDYVEPIRGVESFFYLQRTAIYSRHDNPHETIPTLNAVDHRRDRARDRLCLKQRSGLATTFWLREATGSEAFYAVMYLYYPIVAMGHGNPIDAYIEWWVVNVFDTVGPG